LQEALPDATICPGPAITHQTPPGAVHQRGDVPSVDRPHLDLDILAGGLGLPGPSNSRPITAPGHGCLCRFAGQLVSLVPRMPQYRPRRGAIGTNGTTETGPQTSRTPVFSTMVAIATFAAPAERHLVGGVTHSIRSPFRIANLVTASVLITLVLPSCAGGASTCRGTTVSDANEDRKTRLRPPSRKSGGSIRPITTCCPGAGLAFVANHMICPALTRWRRPLAHVGLGIGSCTSPHRGQALLGGRPIPVGLRLRIPPWARAMCAFVEASEPGLRQMQHSSTTKPGSPR
jgi:hypothetical protein